MYDPLRKTSERASRLWSTVEKPKQKKHESEKKVLAVNKTSLKRVLCDLGAANRSEGWGK